MSTSHPFAALPSQSAKFGAHEATRQMAPVQVDVAWGRAHAALHAPQWLASVARSTQVPLQSVRPTGQTQVLPWQVRPPVQAIPQPPQFAESVRRSRSHPFEALPSQLPYPAVQLNPQVEAVQLATAFARAGHAFPQAPQFAGSDPSTAHAAPQSAWPAGQAHVPAEHDCAAPQVVVHTPQCRASVRTSASQPFATAPSQSANPAAQVATAQAPALQAGTPFGTPQTVPQPPQ